jgi:hypothetical protein
LRIPYNLAKGIGSTSYPVSRTNDHIDHSVGICARGDHLFVFTYSSNGFEDKLQANGPIPKRCGAVVFPRQYLAIKDYRLVSDAGRLGGKRSY